MAYTGDVTAEGSAAQVDSFWGLQMIMKATKTITLRVLNWFTFRGATRSRAAQKWARMKHFIHLPAKDLDMFMDGIIMYFLCWF